MFDTERGLLTFLARSIRANKLHRESNCRILELFQLLINGEHRAKITEFSPAIISQMLQFLLAGNVTAGEKERATIVILSLVQQHLCGASDMADVLTQLLRVFHNGKATGRCELHSISDISKRHLWMGFLTAQFCSTFTN